MPERGLGHPEVRHHADAGLDNQIAFLASALDWVAAHTPRDDETLYLEAVVTTWHNTDPPRGRRAPQPGPGNPAMTAAPPTCRAGSLARIDELLGRRVSMRALALLRIMAGPIVLLHLWPFLADVIDGRIYRDAFYEPYVAWYPELPRGLYVALLWTGAAAAVAMTIGFLTKAATVVTFAVVTYNLFLSTTHYHNNRAYLVIVLGALAITPCGRELSVDAWLRCRRGRPPLDPTAPGWPLWLLRLEAATVYGASGLSKLVDGDWFGGTVTWQRVVRVQDRLVTSPLPDWAITVLTTARSTPSPPRSSWPPSCSSPSGSGGGPPATPRCGSPSASTSPSSSRRRSRSSPISASPRS